MEKSTDPLNADRCSFLNCGFLVLTGSLRAIGFRDTTSMLAQGKESLPLFMGMPLVTPPTDATLDNFNLDGATSLFQRANPY